MPAACRVLDVQRQQLSHFPPLRHFPQLLHNALPSGSPARRRRGGTRREWGATATAARRDVTRAGVDECQHVCEQRVRDVRDDQPTG